MEKEVIGIVISLGTVIYGIFASYYGGGMGAPLIIIGLAIMSFNIYSLTRKIKKGKQENSLNTRIEATSDNSNWQCPDCNKFNSVNLNKCEHCGYEAEWQCPKCNKMNPNNVFQCTNCKYNIT